MLIEQIIVLAIIQGITEFLPISSSGHLVLIPQLTGWNDQGQIIDVAVHVGSLFAVMIYFWRDMIRLISGTAMLVTFRWNEDARLVMLLIVATVPFIMVGVTIVASGYYDDYNAVVRTVEVVAWANMIFAILLWLADERAPVTRRVKDLTMADAAVLGTAQVLAIIPGVSRSGVTMTAGRALSMERTEAARFAMLMSIPTILVSGAAATLKLAQEGEARLQGDAILAAGLSFVAALLAIWGMMALLKRMSMLPFVIYRVVLGLVLFYLAYTGFFDVGTATTAAAGPSAV